MRADGSLRLPVRNAMRTLGASMGVFLLCLPVLAQGNAGRILGSVTDQGGGVITGATVIVTDVQRGISRTLTTDQAGEYAAPNLLPGTYAVRAEVKGFKTVQHSGLLLEVGKDLRVDLTLQPGEQVETITVTEEAPLVETTNSTLGGTLSNETINDLPLNGRNYQNLLVLRPGSMIQPGGGGWTQSTNGIRPEDNGFIVDGLTDDEPLTGLMIINGAGVAGDAATILPIDAIQEVNIEENPPAEYGGKPGAIVNVGLKSGTNSLHGTAYAFGRDSAWDARNYFTPAPLPQRPVALEQFGATAGGPLMKDKLFFFLGFEDERYTVGNFFQASVPEVLPQATPDPANSLPDAIADLAAHNVKPSALSLKLTGCSVGPPVTCTGGVFPTNRGSAPTFNQGFPSTFGSHNGVAKIDYHINDHHSVNGMYFISRGLITAEDIIYVQPQWLSQQFNDPQVFGSNWTWVPNSRWVNQARFGYVHMNRGTHTLDSNVSASSYGINTGVTNPLLGGFPGVNVAGFTSLGGSPSWPIHFGPDTVIQVVDYASYLRGNHAIKFGGEIRHNIVNSARFSFGKGVINFNGGGAFCIPQPNCTTTSSTPLEDLLAGIPFKATVAVGTPQLHLTTWAYSGSVQDDWRVTPRLTVNLGLRYDYITPLKEEHNGLGNFDRTLGLVQVGNQISSPYNGDHLDFAPRLGVSWDISGKGTTVLHAGYSIVADTSLPMYVFIGQGQTNNASTLGLANIPTGAAIVKNGVSTPSTGTIKFSSVTVPGGTGSSLASNWQNNSPSVPLLQGSTVQCGDSSTLPGNPNPVVPCNVLGVDRNFRNPYVSNWTLGVQHAFTNNLSWNLAYVGNHGSRLEGITDLNQPVPVPGSATPNPGPFTKAFPYLGFINRLSNNSESNYNSLQTTLTQRAAHGLSFLASYTYAHALDDDSYNINIFLPQDSTHPGREYASSDFDITHRFTFALTYNIPGIKSPAQLLQGWALNSIVTFQTGQPWLAQDQIDNISTTGEASDRWDFFGNHKDFQSGNSTIPHCSGTSPSDAVCTQLTPANPAPVPLPAVQSAAFFAACLAAATKVDGGVAGGPTSTQVTSPALGCYAQGHSVLIPPALGTFGTMGRNVFRDSGMRNWDLSVTKGWKFKERLTAQFRAEFFNVLNHPNFANPYGGPNSFGLAAFADPSSHNQFGCGCATPDQAGGNPVLGSGGNRAIQLGLKLIF
ncbi:MAG: TonB-dependent receptor [Candidatus Acidiferrales bacterium]